MKKYMKRLFVVLIALVLIFPIVKTFALYDGDSTIFIRVPVEHGAYHIEAAGTADDNNGTKRYFVPGGTEVTLRAEPEEGYHLVGWYTFEEVDSDGQGTMTYPMSDEPITIENEYTFTTEQDGYYNIAPVFAEGIVIDELRFTGALQLETLEEGELPSFTVQTTTPHVTVKAYGDNTGWAKMPNGYTNWVGFGTETPTAVADRTFYAMRLAIEVDEGYVIKPNTLIFYNNRDMWDTFSSITPYEWGGYVYVDFGQVATEPGPSVEGKVIHRVNFDVEMPRIDDEITLIDTDEKFFQTQYGIRIDNKDIEYYGPNGDNNNNYMYIYDCETDDLVEGKLLKDHDYGMVFWITALADYTFADDLEIYVNGEYIDSYYRESETLLGIDYLFQPIEKDVEYNLTSEDGKYQVTFNFPAGQNFDLSIIDILQYTPEQIEEMFDIPAENIKEIISQIKNVSKEYGDLISLYSIEINAGQFSYTSGVTLRILMTDEMKKYNTFKFLFLDENNEFKVQEVHDVVIDGDYLVVNLDHLSAYALVGSNVENSSGNPSTADLIISYIVKLGICILGLLGLGIYTKKHYLKKKTN